MEVRKLFRAALAGGAATLVDLGVLAALVSLCGMSPRGANVPALICGGLVNFVGNRHFAFRATSGSLAKQAAGYGVVEIIALVLNGLLFDFAVHLTNGHAYALVRLATSHLVFLVWSYPLWTWVFRVRRVTSRGA